MSNGPLDCMLASFLAITRLLNMFALRFAALMRDMHDMQLGYMKIHAHQALPPETRCP